MCAERASVPNELPFLPTNGRLCAMEIGIRDVKDNLSATFGASNPESGLAGGLRFPRIEDRGTRLFVLARVP